MNDFSIDKYVEFLDVLKSHYVCMGFKDYLKIDSKNIIDERKVSILRHDVDLLPENSFPLQKYKLKLVFMVLTIFVLTIKAGMKK